MNECNDYLNDPMKGKRKVVCAAISNQGKIVLGVRHHDSFMNNQIDEYREAGGYWKNADDIQGFVDQFGNFLTREEALIVAKSSGQILKWCPGADGSKELFSENLY